MARKRRRGRRGRKSQQLSKIGHSARRKSTHGPDYPDIENMDTLESLYADADWGYLPAYGYGFIGSSRDIELIAEEVFGGTSFSSTESE